MAEKSLTDLPRDLRMMYTKGNDAFQRDNFDYAIAMFNQVLLREPGLYECRKALRIAQLKKAEIGKSIFKKILGGASSSPLIAKGELALHQNPTDALGIAEQILNNDPQSSAGHRLIVKAATTLEMPNTAILSLEILHTRSPQDKQTAIQLANLLANIGEVKRGEKILADLYESMPYDNDVASALKDISARKTLNEGGYEALADGSGSYRDILKDKEEAATLEQQNRVQKSEDTAARLIREGEARLKTDPNNLKLVRSLAELYTEKNEFEKALSYYDRIKASDVGNDPSLDQKIAETKSRKFDFQISKLDPNADDYSDQVALVQAEKQAYQIAECQKRVEKFPTDLQIRFEMGRLYFEAGKISEAIQEFQKARANPHREAATLNYLAQCYAKRNMFDMAARALQDALKKKLVFDEEKKELTYNLGTIFEKMGKKEEAIEQHKQIYEIDIGYKDVAAKVEGYYSGQG